jgi:ribosomal protein S18 acetylase RimI-like enzyme
LHTSAEYRTRIRLRQAEDDAFIVRVATQAFAEFSRDPGRGTLRMARAGVTWIAERGELRVGFAVVHRTGRASAELAAIAVDEQRRARGVGGELLDAVERALLATGVQELTLHTALANLAALELFYKRGYRSQQRLPRFYRGVFEACLMRKQLV